MNELQFSVIIPLYNKQSRIKDTIQSVIKQTIKSFEIIVIDDGSTDGGPDIVIGIDDDRVHLYRQENQGVSGARNKGIDLAQGRYVCFLDADDTWTPDFLETVARLYQKFPDAKMACPSYVVRYNKRVVKPNFIGVSDTEEEIVNDFLYSCTGAFWICNSSCITFERAALIASNERFPIGETVYEDFDLWLRFGEGHPVAHSPKVCSIYNRLTESNARKTHTSKVVYSKSFMDTLRRLLIKYTNNQLVAASLRAIIDRRMVPFIYSLILLQKVDDAKIQIANWRPKRKYLIYKLGLRIALYMPNSLVRLVHSIRLSLF